MQNVMEKSKSVIGKINPYYDMRMSNVKEIYENSANSFDMICTSFRFGYLQGMKAAKAEMRKAGVVNAS